MHTYFLLTTVVQPHSRGESLISDGRRRWLAGDAADVTAVGQHRSNVPRLIDAMRPRSIASARGFASATLELGVAMSRSPFTVDQECPLPRVWRLFRSMGLRHLVVLDGEHCVAGIITRADLLRSERNQS